MKNHRLIAIILAFIMMLIFASCSDNNEADAVKINISYAGLATMNDFERYNNAYSNEWQTGAFTLSKDGYNMHKIICEVQNESQKELSELDFVSYKDENIFYENGAIDIEPSVPIEPNSTQTYEAYIYINNDLNEDEVIQVVESTDFNFEISKSDNSYWSAVERISLTIRDNETYYKSTRFID